MEGQEYQHNADIVCRYFIDKVTEFTKDITERHVLGRVNAWTFSVEHQKGGMPHIHFLVILKDADDLRTPDFVNQYICARIPQLPAINDMTPQAMQQRRLWQLVTRLNMHDCASGRACRVLRVNKQGEPYEYCTKGFKKPLSETTVLSGIISNLFNTILTIYFQEVKYTDYTRLSPENFEELDDDLNPSNDPENPVQYARFDSAQPNNDFDYTKHGLSFFKKRYNTQHEVCLTDQDVVPYNPFLTLKYGTHINIEYVFGQQACKYLFKYILKGC